MPGKGRNATGYFSDTQRQTASVKASKNPSEGKTNAAFDSQVKTKSTSWPQTNDRRTNEATVDVTNTKRKNKATVS